MRQVHSPIFRTTALFLTAFLWAFCAHAADGDLVWAKGMGGSNADGGNCVVVDAAGNVYTTGYFGGTVADFDPGAGVFNLTAAGSADIFVSKLDASGNFVWAKAMGGTGADQGNSIAVDASGNIYTTGYFNGTADFDPGAGTSNLTSIFAENIFVSKLDANGDFVWAKSMGGDTSAYGNSIAVDASGNVYTTGTFNGFGDFDPGEINFDLTAVGYFDIFISKLDANGDFVWAKNIGSTVEDRGNALALDASGNVLVTGYFQNTADFDPGAGVFNLTAAGGTDVFVLKLDPTSGFFIWARTMGGTGTDEGKSLEFDATGNLYSTGFFSGTADFNPGAFVANLVTSGGTGAFISKLDAGGDFLTAFALVGSGSARGNSIVVDTDGNIYTTGYFSGTVNFYPGDDFSLTSAGNNDIFISKLDAAGAFVWAKAIGGPLSDVGNSSVLGAAANLHTTGSFFGTIDFDTGAPVYNLTSFGPDAFVMKVRTTDSPTIHTADQNGDGVMSLSELLRIIQFFNLTALHCDPAGEDGFAPGVGDQTCTPHHSDYNTQDWSINLTELLRMIQFFNLLGYYPCPSVGEDGFCPGTP